MVVLSLAFAPSFAEQSANRPPLLAPGGSCFVLPPLQWRAPGAGLAARRGRDVRVQRAPPVAKLFGWFGDEEGKPRSSLPSAQRLKKAMSQVASFRAEPSPRAPPASAVRRQTYPRQQWFLFVQAVRLAPRTLIVWIRRWLACKAVHLTQQLCMLALHASPPRATICRVLLQHCSRITKSAHL